MTSTGRGSKSQTKRTRKAVVASRKTTNSIINEDYRQTYRDRGNPSHCGDWLALTLEKLTHKPNGEFDLNAFIDILERNGVLDHAKFDLSPIGARGRFRMTYGLRLRAAVRKAGALYTPKGKVTPPAKATRH